MIKVKLIVILGFLLAFAAGGVVGFVSSRRLLPSALATPAPAAAPTTRRVGPMEGLKLSDKQKEQWRAIHEQAGKQLARERDALRKKRDDAVLALLGGQHKSEYEQIMADYMASSSQMDRRGFERIRELIRPQLREILTDEQWAKFEEFDRRMRENHRRGELTRWGEQSATTHPATTLPSH